ncbi:MAG: M28 family metallopeptidase [Acidobacteria bacterium]|jgi:hypothetical protein|nr:M28 family metallopeptidase [Acidobacteriota bacterium]
MKRALAALVLLFGFTLTLGGEPALLIRLERLGPSDREALTADGVPVVLDAQTLLLVHGDETALAALRGRGFKASIVDTDPGRWDYVQAGLRDDSDLDALTAAGPILMSAENWVLVRLRAGESLEPLTRAGAFLYRLPRTGLLPPRKFPRPDAARSDFAGPDPIVQKIVGAVSTAAIDDYWLDLTTNPPTGTRYSPSQGCRDASTYCRDVFAGLGLTAELQTWNAGHAPNAIGTREGAIDPSKVYIVIGHLDDLPSSGPAPGADDNASGTVNVLESARAMNCWAFRNTIKYIACTGEEQGLLGSDAYAQDALNRGEDIRGVINMDMIGWEGNNSPSPENLDLNYNGPSQWLGEQFAAAAGTYGTGLAVDAFSCPSLTASDHAPFWERGWPAVCGITDNEGYCGHGGNYPYYHQSTDTIANCGNKSFFYSVVKTSAATLAELAGPFKITFSQPTYACGASVTVVLGDRDRDTNPSLQETVAVEVWSDTETVPETLVLTERTAHSMLFDAVLPTTTGAPVAGDGLLSVAPGDVLHARYVDALDCDGGTNVPYLADARVDCVGPAISAVGTTAVSDTAAKIVWATDEASDSVATWGAVKPPATSTPGNAETTAHEVSLSGLQACTVYWFDVRSADGAGNLARADNGGAYFHFETLGNFGSGLQPCHAGRVTVDKPVLTCSENAAFRVTDIDLNTDPGTAQTVLLQASSSAEPAGEWVTATETGPNTSVFAASIPLHAGAAVPGDGRLSVADGDTLTATYRDDDDGAGAQGLSYATARLDCAGPAITNLRVEQITDVRATIRFTTAEAGDTVVEWGTTPALGQTIANGTPVLEHAATINQGATCQPLYFRVRSKDQYGNERVASEGSGPYQLQVGKIPGLYWKESFEGSTAGWTLQGDWEVGAPQARGGSGGGRPDPGAAYNQGKSLGHDLSGKGTFPGDYEPSRTEVARSAVLNATTWQRTKLLYQRRLNAGSFDQATVWLYVPNGVSIYNSNNLPVSESEWSLQTFNVGSSVDGKPSVQIEFRQKSDATGNYSGWNVDEIIFKDGALPDFGACGGCAAAPSFAGATGAVDADACGGGGVTVSWERSAAWGTGSGGSYAVYRGTAPGFPADAAHRIAAGVTALAYTDTGAPDGPLHYLVRAENDETCSSGPQNGGVTDDNAVYAPVTNTAARPLPAELASLRVTIAGGAHVHLAWEPVSEAPRYRVYRALAPEPGGFSSIGETGGTAFDDLGQGADLETYFYLVRGVNACGQEGP